MLLFRGSSVATSSKGWEKTKHKKKKKKNKNKACRGLNLTKVNKLWFRTRTKKNVRKDRRIMEGERHEVRTCKWTLSRLARLQVPSSSPLLPAILLPLSWFLSSSSSPCSSHQQHGLLNYRPAGARPMPREGAPPLSKKCNQKMKENPSQFSPRPSP